MCCFLLLVTLVEMEWRKEGEIKWQVKALRLNFITMEISNEVFKGEDLPEQYNSCLPSQGLSSFSLSFFLVPGSVFFFQACSDSSFCQRPLGRLLFLLYSFYFMFFYPVLFYYLIVITFIYCSIPTLYNWYWALFIYTDIEHSLFILILSTLYL